MRGCFRLKLFAWPRKQKFRDEDEVNEEESAQDARQHGSST